MDKINAEDQLAFAEITFAIPAQNFGVTCAISAEEGLPVVTEFVLRMIHISGAMTPGQIQGFFGFNEREVAAVIRTLNEERLVRWEDDRVELTHYALGRFLESSDSIPRFFKIRDWSGEVNFELISFSPARKPTRFHRTNAMVELSARDPNKESKTIYWAERSFQEHFRKILRQDRVEIYKISKVDAGEHFMIPAPCIFSFKLDSQLEIKRSLDEETVADHLEIARAISDVLSVPETSGNAHVGKFIAFFDDPVLSKYLTGQRFEFERYLEGVHVTRTTRYEGGVEPLLGALHLPRNRRTLLQWIKSSFESEARTDQPSALNAFWLGPSTPFWSRSNKIRPLADQINRVLKGNTLEDHGEEPEREEQRKEAGLRTILQLSDTRDRDENAGAHRYNFTRLFGTDGEVLGRKCELFLVPKRFVAVLFHYSHNHPVSVPFGFISSDAGHVEKARQLLKILTFGEYKAYPLNQDKEEETDLKKEFDALVNG